MVLEFNEKTYCKLSEQNVSKLMEQNFIDSRYNDIERDIRIGNIFLGIELLGDNNFHLTTFEIPNDDDVLVKLNRSGDWVVVK